MISTRAIEKPKDKNGSKKKEKPSVKPALRAIGHSTKVCKARCGLNTLIEEEGYRTIEGSSASARACYLR